MMVVKANCRAIGLRSARIQAPGKLWCMDLGLLAADDRYENLRIFGVFSTKFVSVLGTSAKLFTFFTLQFQSSRKTEK